MQKRSKKTLALTRETVRALEGGELRSAAGGFGNPFPTIGWLSYCCQTRIDFGCPGASLACKQ